MKKLQIWYIKFGCFLTGYDFYTLSNCSEVAVRKVKKYTAALIIISIVWAIVGFTFSSRYLKLGTIGCIIGALTSLVLVIQIERQILMVSKTNWKILWARGLLALLMAVIGSLIIDQMIFKEDIDKRKLRTNQEEVDRILPQRTKELDKQIHILDSIIKSKEEEIKILEKEIDANPTQESISKTINQTPITNTIKDTLGRVITKTEIKRVENKTINTIDNPKRLQLDPLRNQVNSYVVQKFRQDSIKLKLQTILEDEVKIKTGFIDELNTMINILKESSIGLIVYLIWFFFLLFIELLILFSKVSDEDSDYELVISQQMEMHIKKIKLLNKSVDN